MICARGGLPAAFEAQARQDAPGSAWCSRAGTLTYGELDARANALPLADR